MKDLNIQDLLTRTTIVFFLLLLLTRLLGKKQLSQLTFFNYVTGITIGSICANIVSNTHRPYLDVLIELIWWCFLSELIGYLGLKIQLIRSAADGHPAIIIKNGKLLKKSLKMTRLKIEDLTMLLREKNVFSITEVDYAILENDGKLSVLKKMGTQYVTKFDMSIPISTNQLLPTQIIVDGRVISENLKEFNFDMNWLSMQLQQQNISNTKDVLYAEIQRDGSLVIEKYE